MRCSLDDCGGRYEERRVTHTVKRDGQIVIIDHVLAEVCSVCGDVLFTPDTVRGIEALLSADAEPAGVIPLYEYAK